MLDEVARFFIEMAERIHAERGPAPQIILKHMRVFADAVDTHPNHTRVMLEWSTALRHEVWPAFLQFQERVIAMLAQTIRRWRMETGNDLDRETEDDARVIAAAGYVLVQMKVAKLPDSRIERFMQTVLRDSLGDGQAPAGAQLRLPIFEVAIGQARARQGRSGPARACPGHEDPSARPESPARSGIYAACEQSDHATSAIPGTRSL